MVSYLIVLLLIVLISISLTAFNLSLSLFNRERLSEILTDVIVDSDLLPTLLSWYSQTRAAQRVETELAVPNENEPDIVLLLAYPAVDDWRAARDLLLPEPVVNRGVRDIVDDLINWIDSSDHLPQVTIDLSGFKAQASSQGPDAVLIALESMPLCTEAQVADLERRVSRAQAAQALLRRCGIPDPWTEAEQESFLACASGDSRGLAALDSLCSFPTPWRVDLGREYVECARIAETGEALYNLCEFEAPYQNDQRRDYEESLEKVIADFPDRFDVTAYLQANDVVLLPGAAPESIKGELRALRLAGYVGPALLVILTLLLILLNRADGGRGFRLAGIALIIGGLLAGAQAAASSSLVARSLLRFTGMVVPAPVAAEISLVSGQLLNSIFQPMLVQALLIVAAGALSLALSLRMRARSESEIPEDMDNLETRVHPKAEPPEGRH